MNPSDTNQATPPAADQPNSGSVPLRPAGLPRPANQRVVPSAYGNIDGISRPGRPAQPPAPMPAAPPPAAAQPAPVPQPPAPANPAAAGPQPVVAGGAAPGTPGPAKDAEKPKPHPNSTQTSLQIAEIRDGLVIMNDGSFRAVVMAKSINFDLMSPQEQEAVEYSYQGFLNSLYFPIQIFMHSQKVDLQPYIERLDKIRTEHDNMLLALLMEDYINYIEELSQQTNIMDKSFYVVIPYFPTVDLQKGLDQSKNFIKGLGKLFKPKEDHVVINEADLEDAKTELRQRVQAVLAGLQQASVQGLPLDTQELIELYYDVYNPDTATRQHLEDIGRLTADVVTKGEGAAPQPHLQRELN